MRAKSVTAFSVRKTASKERSVVVMATDRSDAPEEPEDLAVMDEEEDQEPLEDEETEDSAPTKRKSRKARRKARRSKRKARRSKRKKNLKKLFGRRLTFANLASDISEMMDSVSALSSWTFMYPSERIAMRKLSNMSVVMNENVM